MHSLFPAAVLANTAEISTSDIRKGASFENIKASWGKALHIGDFKSNLRCKYDYNDNKDFLKEASLSGNLPFLDDGDLQVSYGLSHNFKSKNTKVSLSAVTQGTTLAADYDTDSTLKEVSLERDLELLDQKVSLKPSWLVQAKTARIKMMSTVGGGDLQARVDYNTDGGSVAYQVGYARALDTGKDISATFTPDSNELEVEYVDDSFESGATWTAKATVPLDDAASIMDASKLTLKRSWSW